MKNKIEIEKTIIVNKENFQKSLEEFKDLLNDKHLKYIILNNEISTNNPKIIENEGEIVFSEFTICYTSYERSRFKTFFIPSIKYHRYTEDEIASFSPDFLKNITNEQNIYNFNNIYKDNSLSYENLNKIEELKNNLDSISKNGKPFTEENKKSYNYFPKTVIYPSKKYQKKFENIMKYFIEQTFDDKEKIFKNENKKLDKDINNFYTYKSEIYEESFNLLNRILNFKWDLIYGNVDNDIYKIIVDGYKIKNTKETKLLKSDFIEFIKKLIDYFTNDYKELKEYYLIKHKKYMNNELFDNWKQFIQSELEGFIFKYQINNDEEDKLSFKLIPSKKKNNFENILKFLLYILSINENKETKLDDIIYRKIDMKNLFPKNTHKYLEFNYHLSLKIHSKFEIDKTKKKEYISKISYKNLLIHNKNDEEILFKYKITPFFKELFELKNKENIDEKIESKNYIIKSFSLEFSHDLEILYKDKNFKKVLNEYITQLNFSLFNENIDKYRTIKYILNKKPDFNNVDFIKFFELLINIAKNTKKNYLINEEIGLTLFYKLLFDKSNINIYGTNLKNKIYFPIRKLLLEENKDIEKKIELILNKVNIYDIAFICKEKNIKFYMKYMSLKKDENLKNLTMTQNFGYIIEGNEILRNIENLKEYRNKFYLDEKEKIDNKLYIDIDKKIFYKEYEKIINILKDKTDFTININNDNNNNNQFRINFIDPEKFDLINNISKEINII